MAADQSETTQSRYYELSGRLGHALGVAQLVPEPWHCSTSAELSLLLSVADTIGLTKAAEILRPLVYARLRENGDCIQDDEFGNG